jgi:hypothetical protein
MGTGTRRVWVWVKFYTRGYGYGWKFVSIYYTGMGMILLYPAHTLPITILWEASGEGSSATAELTVPPGTAHAG